MNNSSRQNNTPFQSTVHFRRIRELFIKLCRFESIETHDYNFSKMKAYTCYGSDLNGRNVKFSDGRGVDIGSSCWVDDDLYEIVEAPAYNNRNKLTGKFLILAKNKREDYWIFGVLNYSIDREKSRMRHSIFDSASFKIYGRHTVTINGNKVYFSKDLKGRDCKFGGSRKDRPLFDALHKRKNAYKFSVKEFTSKVNGNYKKENKTGLFDKKKVRIYKKKNSY